MVSGRFFVLGASVVKKWDNKLKGLREGSFNPESMTDCSYVLAFAAWDNYIDERIVAI